MLRCGVALGYTVLFLDVQGCAIAAKPAPKHTASQASQPAAPASVGSAIPPASVETPLLEQSATELLSQGFAFLRNGHYPAAQNRLERALATGELNDAGRTLTYWHIYIAAQAQQRMQVANDALSSFVALGTEILNNRDQDDAARDGSDFAQHFDLRHRLAQARATLNAAWAKHTRSFGRTAQSPVLVHNTDEIHYFLELAPPCAPGNTRHAYALSNTLNPQPTNLSEVQLRCGEDESAAVNYFFLTVGGQ